MKSLFLIVTLFFSDTLSAQQVQVTGIGRKVSLRGLSVVNNKVIWVSGSQGTVGLSTNGGNSWTCKTVKGFENTDFRDIEGFDKRTAIIMGIASPARILKTTDGGESWKVVYENKDTSMFLDAMEFWNDMSGIVIGDPHNGKFFIGRTFDGGNTWQTIPEQNKPDAQKGEACFAASGTNIRRLSRSEAVFVTGGMSSNLVIRDRKINLPVKQGSPTSGINSIAIKKQKTMIVVGGDFTYPNDTTGNCAISSDKGDTWEIPSAPPKGYRSCVEYLTKDSWATCGLNGVDFSTDNGDTWKSITDQAFHVVKKAKKGRAVFLAGPDGRIGKLLY